MKDWNHLERRSYYCSFEVREIACIVGIIALVVCAALGVIGSWVIG